MVVQWLASRRGMFTTDEFRRAIGNDRGKTFRFLKELLQNGDIKRCYRGNYVLAGMPIEKPRPKPPKPKLGLYICVGWGCARSFRAEIRSCHAKERLCPACYPAVNADVNRPIQHPKGERA